MFCCTRLSVSVERSRLRPLAAPTLPPMFLQPPLDVCRLDELHCARVVSSAGATRVASGGVDEARLREGAADPLRGGHRWLRRGTLPVDLLAVRGRTRGHKDAGARLVWHADKHLVDAALSVDADEATVKRCRRSHRSTSFFPKSSMCCGTIAIDFTLLRKFTRMQLPPSGVRRRERTHLGSSTCSHRPRRCRSASRRRGPRTTARGSRGCRRARRARDSICAEKSRRYVVGGDRVHGSVDVPNVAQNHLAVAAAAVARRHQVVAVAQPRHVAAARRRVTLSFRRREWCYFPLRHDGRRARVPDLVLAIFHPRAQ